MTFADAIGKVPEADLYGDIPDVRAAEEEAARERNAVNLANAMSAEREAQWEEEAAEIFQMTSRSPSAATATTITDGSSTSTSPTEVVAI